MKKDSKQLHYRMLVEWSDEDRVFVARAPAFPFVAAHGDSEVEAIRELHAAIDLAVESLRKARRPTPPTESATEFSGQVRLRMPASFHRMLSSMAEFEGISLNTLMVELLAEAAGWRSAVPKAHEDDGAIIARETPARYLVGPPRSRRKRRSGT